MMCRFTARFGLLKTRVSFRPVVARDQAFAQSLVTVLLIVIVLEGTDKGRDAELGITQIIRPQQKKRGDYSPRFEYVRDFDLFRTDEVSKSRS